MNPIIYKFKTPSFLQGLFPEFVEIYAYGFFIALGALVAFYVTYKKSKKFGIDLDQLSGLFLWVILAAFVGGKLFYYFEDWSTYSSNPAKMLKFTKGGFVFYGSLIFAVPTIIIWLKKNKINVRAFLDNLAFAGPIVHSFGRIGCFMAGCCHGKVCHTKLGVIFDHPLSLAKPAGVPLYPTQLFDIGVNLIILLTVFLLEKKKKFDGQLFLIYLMMYGVGRTIVEIYRGDDARGFIFGGLLSHSQFIAILVISICGFLWYKWNGARKIKN
jgi:phosphatidylglycerol:prolipoprotein diacylglycerol transferase